MCIHGKRKTTCTEGCGGSAICTHGRRKAECKEGCGGSAVCVHGKRKVCCTEGCGGSAICTHGKRKSDCKEGCGGSAVCVHGTRKARCTKGCAPLCGPVPAHEERDAIATGESAKEKAAYAAAREAVERATDGQPAGEEENERVLGGWRGRKRRSAAAIRNDTEDSSGKTMKRALGWGGSRSRGVRAPRGATQTGRGVIQDITSDGLVEAAEEATDAVAALAMMSVSLWQHELSIDDEGGDDDVGRGDDDDGDGSNNDGALATTPMGTCAPK